MEHAVFPVMPRRERANAFAERHQDLRLAGKDHLPVCILSVIQRADPDRVSRCNQFPGRPVIQQQGELRAEHPKDARAVLFVKRQDHFAVAFAGEGVSLLQERFPDLSKTIDLAVADDRIFPEHERLHPAARQVHDGQPLKPQHRLRQLQDPLLVRAARCRRHERRRKLHDR